MSKEQYPYCTKLLQAHGVPYPRTCAECGLGPYKREPPASPPAAAQEAEPEDCMQPGDCNYPLCACLHRMAQRAEAAERDFIQAHKNCIEARKLADACSRDCNATALERNELRAKLAAATAPASPSAEELLHIAICQAVGCLTQGDAIKASSILRQSLVDYADLGRRGRG